MRKLIVIVLLAAFAYGGYWFVGKSQIQARLTEALESIDAGPVDLTYTSLHTRGFPSRFDTTITDLVFEDPTLRTRWSAPIFQLFALSYRPNEVIAVFPTEQILTVNDQDYTLFTNDMRASGRVRANAALTFQTATIDMDNPRLRNAEGAELAMASVLAAMRLTPDTPQSYDVFFEARSIVLPEDIRSLIDPQNQQPPIIQYLRFDSDMDLTAPIALTSEDPPQIASISIKEFALTWGDMSLSAIGDVVPDAAGILNGSITISARNWAQAVDLAVATGTLSQDRRFLATQIAGSMDETPHIADTLTVTLSISDGNMMLGGFPLGPAPVLR